MHLVLQLFNALAHTYPDIFQSAEFSFRIQKKSRPYVSCSNHISPSTCIRMNPTFRCLRQQSMLTTNKRNHPAVFLAPYFTRKRLAPISLRQRIRKHRDSTVHTKPYSKRILKKSVLGSVFDKLRIHHRICGIYVDEGRSCNEKVVD